MYKAPKASHSVTLPIYIPDKCFGEYRDTYGIYSDSIKSVVASSLEGINSTVFMYGQTGSGKTYTMLGEYSTEIAEFLKKRKNRKGREEKLKATAESRSTSATIKRSLTTAPNIIANIARHDGGSSRNSVVQQYGTSYRSSEGNSAREPTPEPKKNVDDISRKTATTGDDNSFAELLDESPPKDSCKSDDGEFAKTEGILVLALKDVFAKKEEVRFWE